MIVCGNHGRYKTDSLSSSTVATITTCFLTVAVGFLVTGIVTFWHVFCRCCVGGGDGDLRSGEDFLGMDLLVYESIHHQTLNAWCHLVYTSHFEYSIEYVCALLNWISRTLASSSWRLLSISGYDDIAYVFLSSVMGCQLQLRQCYIKFRLMMYKYSFIPTCDLTKKELLANTYLTIRQSQSN